MEEVLDKKFWNDYLRGYTIYDCTIYRSEGFGFVFVEEKDDRDELPKTRFITMSLNRPMDKRFGVVTGTRYDFCTIACSVNPPEYVAVDIGSQVFSASALRMGGEKNIDQVIDMKTYRGEVGIINKLVRAAGQIYALGNYRKIYRRIGVDQWVELGKEGKGVPVPRDVEAGKTYATSLGFVDMSAFSANDMYAVGGKGDVWRFDGTRWHDCSLPTNVPLSTVCCAGDGLVYISELNGSVWAGRADQWKRIAEADIAWGHQPVDSVWFNQRLYLGAQEGLWTVDRNRKRLVPLSEVERDAPNATNGGRLDLSPDGKYLLTAGPHGACLNDGTGWKRLFNAFDFM
ncbi:hypothetical protein F2P44_22140 [Massilia sp. CCM 8695]|uniref:WD40 repeat domain-containing protein n=1 Tax=Massilia frigida TaxID=2609281 RepID=A0ABX0N9X6_9BURK|nr:hypothetical protein [Massilia frigida]NHZ81954.1 hypothetical protein [Massilia frigida]